MVNVAVVGTGKMAQLYLKMLTKLSNVALAGVVGRTKATTDKLADEYSTNSYSSIDELVSNSNVDLVAICLPTYLHAETVKKIAQKGKSIICEKPLGMNVQECQSMIKECENNNVKLFVGHTLRFNPEYVNARTKVQNGIIGNPGVIQLSRQVPYPKRNTDWFEDESKSGGIILDLGIHDIDWLRWTFGDVERVMVRRIKNTDARGNKAEIALITLRLANGTIAHLHLTWGSPTPNATFELTGDKGMISYNSQESNPLSVAMHDYIAEDEKIAIPKHILIDTPLDRELKHFIDCYENDLEPIITPEEATHAVEIANAIRQSAEKGQPVMVKAKSEVYER